MEKKNKNEEIKEASVLGTDRNMYIYKNHYNNLHLYINAINLLMAQDYLIDTVRFPADWYLKNIDIKIKDGELKPLFE